MKSFTLTILACKKHIIQIHVYIWRLFWESILCEPLILPPEAWHPSVSPPQVLYIYNEIQMRISRTVSMPRVAVWILLTLISWIMLIFTLSAHRQQTLHDTGVVTAASVWLACVCVRACLCVLAWLPCFQIDLHVKGRTNYITYANAACMFERTRVHTANSYR